MAFVLFTPAGGRSSGDLYARRLADAVAAAVVPIAGRAPVPDAETFASVQSAWQCLAPDARPLIASTVLAAFAPIASVLPERRAIPLIYEPLGSAAELNDAERAVLVAIEQEALASASVIVASSEATADGIAHQTATPRERIAIIEPPTPEYPRASGSAALQTLILAASAQATNPEREMLFAALAGLGDLEWRLCIAGRLADSAEEADAVARLAAKFGIAGRVERAPLGDALGCEALWQSCDLFASTAAHSGYGLATAAAMKRGLPMAIAAEPRSAPRIPPEAGATVSPGDTVQLTKALRRLIFDRDLRATMGEASWQAGKALPDSGTVGARFCSAVC
ncbi:MAG: glycosyltransferase [Acetobacteraceae bacterium]